MARRSRYRTGDAAEASPTSPRIRSVDMVLEDISHELKLIDIKRRAIRETSARLPWLYVVTGILGFFLLGSILGISVLGMFIFGGLFSGALANIVGPTGALTARRRAYVDIAKGKERLVPMVRDLPDSVDPVIFAVTRVDASGVQTADEVALFRDLSERHINERGAFDFGDYKYVGFAFRQPDGMIDINHPAIKKQYWLTEARRKKIKDTNTLAVVERMLERAPSIGTANVPIVSQPA